MDALDVMRAERGIRYAARRVLEDEGIPRELWPMVMDSAANSIKDEAITTLAMRAMDIGKEVDDGGHPDRDR